MSELRPGGEILRGLESERGGVYLLAPSPSVTPFFHKAGDISGLPGMDGHMWLLGRFFDGLPAFAKTNGWHWLKEARKGNAEGTERLAVMFRLDDAARIVEDEGIESERDFRASFLNGIIPGLKSAADNLIEFLEMDQGDFRALPPKDIRPWAEDACDPIEAQQTRIVLERFDDNYPVNFTGIVEENAPFTLSRLENNGIEPTTGAMFNFIVKRCLPWGRTASRDGSLITLQPA